MCLFLLRIGRHFLQLQAAIEVLRMLEVPQIFHRFAPTDYVELYAAATVIASCQRQSIDSHFILYLASKSACSSSFSSTYFK